MEWVFKQTFVHWKSYFWEINQFFIKKRGKSKLFEKYVLVLFVAIFGLRVKNLIIWSVLSHFVQWHFFLFCQNSILDSGDFILEIDLFWLAKYSWNQFPNTRISYYFWLKSCPWKNLISNTISDFMPVHPATVGCPSLHYNVSHTPNKKLCRIKESCW